MKNNKKRLPSRHLNQMLPSFLEELNMQVASDPRRVLEGWKDVVGEKLASLSEAVSFQNHILTVKVKSATLFSLFCQVGKAKFINKYQEILSINVRDIIFRIG